MKKNEDKALASIAIETDTDKLLQWVKAAKREGASAVEIAAMYRLAQIKPRLEGIEHEEKTVEYACWQMVSTVEAERKVRGRTVWRMHRLRPKIEKVGEVEALAYCIQKQTVGFAEMLGYGMPGLTAEAIALRFPARFKPEILAAARARLELNKIEVDADGKIVA